MERVTELSFSSRDEGSGDDDDLFVAAWDAAERGDDVGDPRHG